MQIQVLFIATLVLVLEVEVTTAPDTDTVPVPTPTPESGCDVRFIGEPSIPSPTPITCSLINATINLRCSLEADISYLLRVHWYHTFDISLAGSSSVLPLRLSEIDRYGVSGTGSISFNTGSLKQVRSYNFVIRGVREVDYGYWWCRVEANFKLQRTPSKIVGIAAPCNEDLPQCIEPQNFHEGVTPRCALDQLVLPNLQFASLPKCLGSSLQPPLTRSPDPTLTPSVFLQQPPNDSHVYGYVAVAIVTAVVTTIVVLVIVSIILCIWKFRGKEILTAKSNDKTGMTNSVHVPMQSLAANVFSQPRSQHASPLQDQSDTKDTEGKKTQTVKFIDNETIAIPEHVPLQPCAAYAASSEHMPLQPCAAYAAGSEHVPLQPCAAYAASSEHVPLQPCAAYVFGQTESQHTSPLQDQPDTDEHGGHIYDEVKDSAARSGGYFHRRCESSSRAVWNNVYHELDDSGEYALADGDLNGDRYSLVSEHDTDVGSMSLELEDFLEESYVEPNNASQLNAPCRMTVYSKDEGSFPSKVDNGGAVTEGYLSVVQS